jgi:hypothetical protein
VSKISNCKAFSETRTENNPPFKVKNGNSAEKRGKKESPTVKPWDFYRKMGVKTGNSVVKTRKYVRKEAVQG